MAEIRLHRAALRAEVDCKNTVLVGSHEHAGLDSVSNKQGNVVFEHQHQHTAEGIWPQQDCHPADYYDYPNRDLKEFYMRRQTQKCKVNPGGDLVQGSAADGAWTRRTATPLAAAYTRAGS